MEADEILPEIREILTDEQVLQHSRFYYHRANDLEHKFEIALELARMDARAVSPRDTSESFDGYQARLIAEAKLDQLEAEAKRARFRCCEYAGQLLLRQRERESR